MLSGRKIGITGHQARKGLDWSWTRSQVAGLLRSAAPVEEALTSLAVGSDQLFAEEAIAQHIAVTAIIPFDGYARCFQGSGLASYRRLLAYSARAIILEPAGSEEEAFLAAGIRVADDCDLLIAVWDGKSAEGIGGTADVVAHALASGRAIVHLDPFRRDVRRIPPFIQP